jgi:hypothetical protein
MTRGSHLYLGGVTVRASDGAFSDIVSTLVLMLINTY